MLTKESLQHYLDDGETMDRVEDFLAHHGVKGMKWGVRRAEGHVSGSEVKAARTRLHSDLDSIEHHAAAIRASGSTAEKNRHLAAIHEIANRSLKNGDDDKGTRLTVGKGVLTALGGQLVVPIPAVGAGGALAAHAAYKHKQFQDTHELLKKHASSTLKDY
jgi:hypothetical protein